MFPYQLQSVLARHWRDPKLRKKSIFIEGASGIGKSDIIHGLAREFKAGLRDKRFSQMDAVDLGGTPWKSPTGFTKWAPPDWMEFLPTTDDEGFLFMDEITSASREVFAASYQLFLDRAIGGAKVPDGWMIIAAGNRVSDRGVINTMPSPLGNRFVKVCVEPHLDSWRDWAAKRGVDHRLLSWVSYQPEYLHNFSPEIAQTNEQFASPRSLVSCADYLDWDKAERVEMIAGCIGKSAAAAFESYLRVYSKLPSAEEMLADPLGCKIPKPEELGERYAVAMLCSKAMDRTTFNSLWQYADRLGAQFVTLAVRLACRRDDEITTARGYRDFSSKHSAVFERG